MTPRPVRVEGADDGLIIEWNDGHQSRYPGKFLRLSCQCAECVDEWTRRPRIHEDDIAEDVAIEEGEMVGNYALRFRWSDGHDSGIYSFTYLRGICQCDACRSRSPQEGPTPRV